MLLLLACTPSAEVPTDSKVADTQDTTETTAVDSDTTSTTGGTETLVGTVPAVAIAAPEFSATNRDGTPRSRDDLEGHPTILWFYPAATTSG